MVQDPCQHRQDRPIRAFAGDYPMYYSVRASDVPRLLQLELDTMFR